MAVSNVAGLFPRQPTVVAPGAVHLPGWLDADGQRRLVTSCLQWAEEAGGFRSPRMPRGGTMSVGITCLGWHWYPYRYSRTVDDGDGRPVAAFPDWLGSLSQRAVVEACALDHRMEESDPAGSPWLERGYRPDVGLVNWYSPDAHMGMHTDRDERSPAPVVSLSLGDSCVFRFGSTSGRGRPWTDVVLVSGDLFVFGGPARQAFHGVPKLLAGTGNPEVGIEHGRLNLTIRESGLD